MLIYDTLSREKREFTPANKTEYTIYACGPTVYNFIHIGNARPICVFDTLRRYLEYRGNKVNFVQNFTDIDDKIIRKAEEESVSASEISERFIAEYKTDASGLNVREATIHPKVTENIDAVIALIESLFENGLAYIIEGDGIYFDVEKYPEYGKLSNMPLDELKEGASQRVEATAKHSPLDFALWKFAKPGEVKWETPWGDGRPGWHIECSAMARKYLGDTIDLHCGGQDLIFPHHENEIAQSVGASGKPFALNWMHNGFINVDGNKMAKSAGNFFTVRDVAAKYGYEPIRFMMLSSHYRSPINYSLDVITSSQNALTRLYTFADNLDFAIEKAESDVGTDTSDLESYKQSFIDAMDNDFNTADAMSEIFNLVRHVNSVIETAKKEYLTKAKEIFEELVEVLGLLYNRKTDDIPEQVKELAEKRTKARAEKDWAAADAARDEIKELGYEIKETKSGVQIVKL